MAAIMQTSAPRQRTKTKIQKKSVADKPALTSQAPTDIYNLEHEIQQARAQEKKEKEKQKQVQPEKQHMVELTMNDIHHAKQLQLQQQSFRIKLCSNPDEISPKQL